MKQRIKRQNLNDGTTPRFNNSENRRIHANKRKLTFTKNRTPKAMGQQPSNNGFCHH